MSSEPTSPHDYKALLEACPSLTIVGGQAVNVWAITYLDRTDPKISGVASIDLDVIAKTSVKEIISALPQWKASKIPMWAFGDGRLLTLSSKSTDGRILLVELLKDVPGLNSEDIEAVQQIEKDGVRYRLLDPIAMVKSKATNVRKYQQDGPLPRQDRPHLQIIAQCVAPFLRDAHQQAAPVAELHSEFARTVSRAFKTLSDKHVSATLLELGISPRSLIPEELSDSPILKVQTAFAHQLPRLAQIRDKSFTTA